MKKTHQCFKINTMSLSYTAPRLTVRLSNCNEEVLGDLKVDSLEMIMKNRSKLRGIFIIDQLIPTGCIEHCMWVGLMRKDGWKRVGEA